MPTDTPVLAPVAPTDASATADVGHGAWWPSQPPPEPPYVDGPLSIAGPGPAPAAAFVWGPEPPGPVPPTSPARRPRSRAAVVVVAAVVATLLAVSAGLVRGLPATDIAQSSAPPSTTAPPSTSAPTTRPLPSTTVPTTPPSTAAPGSPRSQPGTGTPSTSTPRSSTIDWQAVADEVDPAVVDIDSKLSNAVGAGTGIILSSDGYVVTNNHVVAGATQVVATRVTTGDTYTATVVATDPTHDVAVVHLAEAHGLPTAAIGDSDAVAVGDEVAAIGNAGGTGGTPTVAPGRVIGLHQPVTASDTDGTHTQTLTDLIQVDANVQPGDSGGPLVDADGKVIGIDVAASVNRRGATQEGFAIPIKRAVSIAEQLEAHPSSPSGGTTPALGSGYLGVEVRDATGADGAAVASVQAGGPGAGAGLQAGDVITAVDQTPVASGGDLTAALASRHGGDRVAITVQRSDGSHRLTVTLGSR